MPCDPSIDDFYLHGADLWGFVSAPFSCHVDLANAGQDLGNITVHFDAAPAMTDVPYWAWRPVDLRSFQLSSQAHVPFDQDLRVPAEDALIRAVAIGDSTVFDIIPLVVV